MNIGKEQEDEHSGHGDNHDDHHDDNPDNHHDDHEHAIEKREAHEEHSEVAVDKVHVYVGSACGCPACLQFK